MSHIQFTVAESRNGLPIIEAVVDGKPLLLHSKYDPVREAERFIDSVKDKIEAADHILFYGAGMGYHIKAFFERYPEKIASVYEPFNEISNLTTQYKSMTKFPFALLEHYVVLKDEQLTLQTLSVFNTDLHHNFEIIVLPSYGKWQDEQFREFVETFKKFVDTKMGNIVSATAYSRRWTINALMNLPKTMEHSNFLIEKKEFFKGKPAIIVSAGPSLSEEIENLRKIKNDGSAYIFAVGSAYKALIKANIYPNAICTYDPQNHNYAVFNELVKNNIDTIPMIYGTTVGFETVDYYKGPKLYFPVSQDKLTVNFHKDRQIIIFDATTIAIVTLQLLNLLEVSKVILVGQNFAFKKDKYYAEGINRYDEKKKEASDNTANEKDLKKTFEVEDVHGAKVLTNDEFRRMKNDMENYLSIMEIPVINTTNGGAAIKGTTYKPLEELMNEELTSKVVVEDWWKSDSVDSSSILNHVYLRKYRKAFEDFEEQDKELQKFLLEFNQSLPKLKDNQIQRKLEKFDDLFQSYHQNVFYESTILPVAQLAFEKLVSENQLIIATTDLKKKAEMVINAYINYLQQCLLNYLDIAPIVGNYTLKTLNEKYKVKSYVATSGVFHYEGELRKKYPPEKEKVPEDLTDEEKKQWHKQKKLEDKIDLSLPMFVEMTQKGAIVQFRFKGTKLSLYGLNITNEELKLKIQIDNKSRVVSVSGNNIESIEGYIRKSIYSVSNLRDTVHNITLEVLSNNPHFLFDGIEINNLGRAYHIFEVEKVEDLEIGKRIRCHYKAAKNTIGEFSRLGEENSNFLTVEPTANPNGDFYYICVDNKLLIADRNIQNEISWVELEKNQLIEGNNCLIKGSSYITRLLDGGDSYQVVNNSNVESDFITLPKNNEWSNFIKDSFVWNTENNVSWTKNRPKKGIKHPFNRIQNNNISVDKYAVARGGKKNYLTFQLQTLIAKGWGFRPVLVIDEN